MDDELRRLGRAARHAIERDVDTDAARDEFVERDLGALTGVEHRSDRSRWWLITAAAAVVVLAIGTIARLANDDPGELATSTEPSAPVVTQPEPAATTTDVPITDPPPATTAPPSSASTVASSSTAPATTEPPPTTIPPTTTLPGVPPAPSVVAFDDVAVGDGARIERNCVEGRAYLRCTQLALAPDGTVVSLDPVASTLTWHGVPEVRAPLPDGLEQAFIEAVGPDRVVYLNVQSPGVEDPVGDLVAVTLADGDAGREVRRWPESLDRSGDTYLVPTPTGIVVMGCCGHEPVRPAPDAEVRFPWVDRDGEAVESPLPNLDVAFGGSTVELRRDDRAWQVELAADEHMFRGMPPMVATYDGGVLAMFDRFDATSTIVRGHPDGSTEVVVLDRWPDLVDRNGVVMADADALPERFSRAELFAPPPRWEGSVDVDVDNWTLTAPELSDHLDGADPTWEDDPVAFADAVAGAPAVNELRTVRVVDDTGDRVTVEVATANFLDDSTYAVQHRFELARRDDGSLRLTSGEYAVACQPDRGHQSFERATCR